MARTRRAEIAGAGYAGLAAAISLARRGWRVRVHEANHELRELGAGIFMWENGLRALDRLGVRGQVETGAFKPSASEVRIDGELKSSQPTNTAESYPMLTMTRQQMYAPMLQAALAAGADIVTGSRAIGADPAGQLLLEDGRRLPADLIVGADGVGSRVRDSLTIESRRTAFGFGITRVLTSRNGFRGPDWDKVVDFWRHGRRPRRILYVPCTSDVAYLAMMAESSDARGISIPVEANLWQEDFPVLAPLIAEIGTTGRFDPYQSLHLARWSLGTVALVGDSAHGMPPTLGQGAGCAIVNAEALGSALERATDVAEALRLWEARIRPATDRIQSRAEEFAAMGMRRSLVPKAALGAEALAGARTQEEVRGS